VALALEVKEILAVLVFALRASRPVKAAVAAVLVVEEPLQHPLVGLVLVVPVSPTPFKPDHLRLMAAVAAAVQWLMHTLRVDRVGVAEAHSEPGALQQAARQIPAAVAVAELRWDHKTLLVVALVSWWSATALHNFSTGETHETHHSGHHCGPDPDGLRYKPRRLLRCHCCA
jgi:threonine/homoserine efflux transporter RhtA